MTTEQLNAAEELLQSISSSCKERETHYRDLYINKPMGVVTDEDIKNSERSTIFYSCNKKITEALTAIEELKASESLWSNNK